MRGKIEPVAAKPGRGLALAVDKVPVPKGLGVVVPGGSSGLFWLFPFPGPALPEDKAEARDPTGLPKGLASGLPVCPNGRPMFPKEIPIDGRLPLRIDLFWFWFWLDI